MLNLLKNVAVVNKYFFFFKVVFEYGKYWVN